MNIKRKEKTQKEQPTCMSICSEEALFFQKSEEMTKSEASGARPGDGRGNACGPSLLRFPGFHRSEIRPAMWQATFPYDSVFFSV